PSVGLYDRFVEPFVRRVQPSWSRIIEGRERSLVQRGCGFGRPRNQTFRMRGGKPCLLLNQFRRIQPAVAALIKVLCRSGNVGSSCLLFRCQRCHGRRERPWKWERLKGARRYV